MNDEATVLTEEQIVGTVQDQEAGTKGADPCRKNGKSEGTFHAWKAKHCRIPLSEDERLKAPRGQDTRTNINPRTSRLQPDQWFTGMARAPESPTIFQHRTADRRAACGHSLCRFPARH